MAKYAAWRQTITDQAGNIQPNAQITVRQTVAGNPLATLYSTRTGTALSNPFNADADGYAEFFVEGGSYHIEAVLGSYSKEWNYVAIGTAGEYDANNLLFAFAIQFAASGKPASSEALLPFNVPLGMTLLAADALAGTGWFAKVKVKPSTTKVVSLVKGGVEFATITFTTASFSGTFAMASDVELSPGDQVWPVMPASADSLMSDFSMVMLARR